MLLSDDLYHVYFMHNHQFRPFELSSNRIIVHLHSPKLIFENRGLYYVASCKSP